MILGFRTALISFAILGILAAWALDGKIRLMTLLILGAFALKVVLVELRRRMD
jgi:hypothetical protein